MALIDDQGPVHELASDAAHKAFGEKNALIIIVGSRGEGLLAAFTSSCPTRTMPDAQKLSAASSGTARSALAMPATSTPAAMAGTTASG